MKRLLIAVLVVLVLMLGVAPWVIGIRAEQRYREIIADANGRWSGIRLTLQEYQRGWYESRALVRVDVGEPTSRYRYTDHIAHGPLPFAAIEPASRRQPALVYSESELRLVAGTGHPLPLHATSHYALGFTGAMQGAIQLLPLRFESGAGQVLNWQGGVLRYRVSDAYEHIQSALHVKPLRADFGDVQIQLSGLDSTVNLRRSEHGLWLGPASVNFQRLSLTDENENGAAPSVRIQGFSYEQRSGLHDGVLTAQLTSALERIRLGEATFGPGRMAFRANGLDAAALARIQHTVIGLSGQGMEPRALAMAVMGTLLVALPELLQHQPRLELQRLTLSAPHDELRAQGYLTLDTHDPKVLNNLYLLSRAIEARLQARVPGALAERLAAAYLQTRSGQAGQLNARVQSLLDQQVAAGVLVRDHGAYRTEIRYTDGALVINGKPWGAMQGAAVSGDSNSKTHPNQ